MAETETIFQRKRLPQQQVGIEENNNLELLQQNATSFEEAQKHIFDVTPAMETNRQISQQNLLAYGTQGEANLKAELKGHDKLFPFSKKLVNFIADRYKAGAEDRVARGYAIAMSQGIPSTLTNKLDTTEKEIENSTQEQRSLQSQLVKQGLLNPNTMRELVGNDAWSQLGYLRGIAKGIADTWDPNSMMTADTGTFMYDGQEYVINENTNYVKSPELATAAYQAALANHIKRTGGTNLSVEFLYKYAKDTIEAKRRNWLTPNIEKANEELDRKNLANASQNIIETLKDLKGGVISPDNIKDMLTDLMNSHNVSAEEATRMVGNAIAEYEVEKPTDTSYTELLGKSLEALSELDPEIWGKTINVLNDIEQARIAAKSEKYAEQENARISAINTDINDLEGEARRALKEGEPLSASDINQRILDIANKHGLNQTDERFNNILYFSLENQSNLKLYNDLLPKVRDGLLPKTVAYFLYPASVVDRIPEELWPKEPEGGSYASQIANAIADKEQLERGEKTPAEVIESADYDTQLLYEASVREVTNTIQGLLDTPGKLYSEAVVEALELWKEQFEEGKGRYKYDPSRGWIYYLASSAEVAKQNLELGDERKKLLYIGIDNKPGWLQQGGLKFFVNLGSEHTPEGLQSLTDRNLVTRLVTETEIEAIKNPNYPPGGVTSEIMNNLKTRLSPMVSAYNTLHGTNISVEDALHMIAQGAGIERSPAYTSEFYEQIKGDQEDKIDAVINRSTLENSTSSSNRAGLYLGGPPPIIRNESDVLLAADYFKPETAEASSPAIAATFSELGGFISPGSIDSSDLIQLPFNNEEVVSTGFEPTKANLANYLSQLESPAYAQALQAETPYEVLTNLKAAGISQDPNFVRNASNRIAALGINPRKPYIPDRVSENPFGRVETMSPLARQFILPQKAIKPEKGTTEETQTVEVTPKQDGIEIATAKTELPVSTETKKRDEGKYLNVNGVPTYKKYHTDDHYGPRMVATRKPSYTYTAGEGVNPLGELTAFTGKVLGVTAIGPDSVSIDYLLPNGEPITFIHT